MRNHINLLILAAVLLGVMLSPGQDLGRGGQSVYQYFASDYGPRTSVTLTNVIAEIGTSRWCNLVLDGGTWTISTNVTVPSNIALIYARGSSLSVGSGCTVTVNTVYNEIGYAASYRALSNVYALAYYAGTETAGTNLDLLYYPRSNPSGFVNNATAATNGFIAVGGITSPAFYGGAFLSTGGNAVAAGNINSAAPAGTNNTVYANNAQVLSGINNIISNANSVAAGRGNLVRGDSSMAGGLESIANGNYAMAWGQACSASQLCSIAMGNDAQADDQYSFVWADSLGSSYQGNGSNTFNVRAAGGVYLGGTMAFDSNFQLQDAVSTNFPKLSGANFNSGITGVQARITGQLVVTNITTPTGATTNHLVIEPGRLSGVAYGQTGPTLLLRGGQGSTPDGTPRGYVWVQNLCVSGTVNGANQVFTNMGNIYMTNGASIYFGVNGSPCGVGALSVACGAIPWCPGSTYSTLSFGGKTLWTDDNHGYRFSGHVPASSTENASNFTISVSGTNVYICVTNNWLGSGTNWLMLSGKTF